jgi:predicted nucleic acid-binding protein
MIYCDSAYLLKFYIPEPGSSEVRALLDTQDVASCCHGQVEVVSAIHRKWREGLIGEETARQSINQFISDNATGSWVWHPLNSHLLSSTQKVYQRLPASVFLRASDALHLACAKEHGFREIYSNDKHLLAAAKHFGIKGRNVIK